MHNLTSAQLALLSLEEALALCQIRGLHPIAGGALPQTLDPTVPANTDSPSQGASQIRGVKQYVSDTFGLTTGAGTSQTAAAFSITQAGLVTISQSPLTVPTLLQGAASQVLRIGSPYSAISFEINTATVLAITATGLLQQTRYHEWASGITGVLGTQGAQPLLLRANTLDQWQVTPSGMFTPVASVVDLGTPAGPNPRNLYLASNLIVGGQIQAGAAPRVVTTPTGMLDGTQLTFAGEAQGAVLFRGVSTWQQLAPGAVGQVFVTQGAAANPIWQTGSPGVAIGDNPAWTGRHTWSIGTTMYMSSPSVMFGLGTSTPTQMLDIAGSLQVASTMNLGGNFLLAGVTGLANQAPVVPAAGGPPVWGQAGIGIGLHYSLPATVPVR